MIAVLFEVYPKPGCEAGYLDLAAALRPLVEKVDGFISVERFRSVSPEGKVLSLSFWRDENAVVKWREVYEHRIAQMKGAFELFENYRIRVFNVDLIRDYGMTERFQAPQQLDRPASSGAYL
jgi:heme-degrading monooxygenase HmoA